MIFILYLDLNSNIFETYNEQQPFIKIFGKNIFEWILESNELDKFSSIIILYNNIQYKQQLINTIASMQKQLGELNRLINIFYTSENEIKALNDSIEDKNEQVLFMNSHYFYLEQIYDDKNTDKNYLFYMKDETNNVKNIDINLIENEYVSESIYNQYLKKNQLYLSPNDDLNIINDISNISHIPYMTNNLFCNSFILKSFRLFNSYLSKLFNLRTNNFIKELILLMLKDNIEFEGCEISNDMVINLNSPFHIRIFSNNFPRINAFNNNLMVHNKTIKFELENTLIYKDASSNRYIPIQKNIDILNYLRKLGNNIVIYTYIHKEIDSNNLYDMLVKFNINYDSLLLDDKPIDFCISSQNISSYQNLEKSLGFYNNKIECREFNEIIDKDIATYKKISDDLSGEIYYYKNIPNQLKDIFPILFDYDKANNRFFEIEKINGISLSHLYLNEELTIQQFDHVLGTLRRIHDYKGTQQLTHVKPNDVNIYDNYSKKLICRYKNYDYSNFENHQQVYEHLLHYLTEYENNDKGFYKMIHGDPVFSNILINKFGKIKLIDMRGKQGDTNSMYGDLLYDYAKIYQSLIGYDEILLDKHISENYKNGLINHFLERFKNEFGLEYLFYLKTITASLLFTLIPLHNNEKCGKYYGLIEKYNLLNI